MTATKPKMRFRLLHGRHNEGLPDGTRREYGASEPQNNIVESEKDLEALFNRGEARKFERIHEGQVIQQLAPTSHVWDETKETLEQFMARMKKPTLTAEALRKLTPKQLQELAEEKEIDLKGATKPEDIIRLILGK